MKKATNAGECKNSGSVKRGKPRRYLLVMAMVAGTIALGGCSLLKDFQGLAKVDPLVKPGDDPPAPVNLDDPNPKRLYLLALSVDDDKDERKIARNQLQALLLRRSDEICEEHKGNIYANAAVFNVTTGFLTSALAGAAAIVTGPTAVSVLAGSSALSNATRSLVNDEVYQQQLTAGVIAEITDNRKTRLHLILGKRSKDISDYAMDDAIREAQNYHQMCSFYQGITSLLKKAGRKERPVPTRTQINAQLKEFINEETRLVDRIDALREKLRDAKPPVEQGIQNELAGLEMQLRNNKVQQSTLISVRSALLPDKESVESAPEHTLSGPGGGTGSIEDQSGLERSLGAGLGRAFRVRLLSPKGSSRERPALHRLIRAIQQARPCRD